MQAITIQAIRWWWWFVMGGGVVCVCGKGGERSIDRASERETATACYTVRQKQWDGGRMCQHLNPKCDHDDSVEPVEWAVAS